LKYHQKEKNCIINGKKEKKKNNKINGILTPFDNNQVSISSIKACTISQFQNKCSIVSSSSWQKVEKALSFTLILYRNVFVS
jgi:hypothetical protein